MITHVERLADGRYNIVLRGLERFRVLEEDHARSYRRAIVEPLPNAPLTARRPRRRPAAAGEARSAAAPPSTDRKRRGRGPPRCPSAMSDEDLVNALAQYLDLEPLEKQALLEHQACGPAPSRSSSCSR